MDNVVLSGAEKTGGLFLSPLGKINLWITAGFFIVMFVVGAFESVEQHSMYPLVDKTVLKLVAADHKLSESIDVLESKARPDRGSVFSKTFPAWLWFWLKFWFVTIANVWFIYFFIWLLFTLFQFINSDSVARSVFLALLTFAIVQLITGLALYPMSKAGQTLPSDRLDVFNEQVSHSYPFEGTIKLVRHVVNKDLFYKIYNISQTPIGEALTNIPSNVSVNST